MATDWSKVEQARVKIHWRDRLQMAVRRFFYRFRIDVCFDESDGFDVGAFVANWKRARGPFLLHQQFRSEAAYCADFSPECCGPWRLMIALTPAAYRGFDEGAIK